MLLNKGMEEMYRTHEQKATILLLFSSLFLTSTTSPIPLLDSTAAAATTMASSSPSCLLLSFFVFSILLINHQTVKCADEEDVLFQGLNSYRKSLNFPALTKNDNAECLADELADKFKNQPCTNTTGSNTVPGNEPQFTADYPKFLTKCHLNVSNTRDGSIMPACVPNLDPNLVLTNFTMSQYSGSLNDTKYTGAGIGSDGNWIVVVLTTSTPEGSFVPADAASLANNNAASLTTRMGQLSHFLFLLLSSFFFL